MRWIGSSKGSASVSLVAAATWLAMASPARAASDWNIFLGAEATLDTGGIVRGIVTDGPYTFVANDTDFRIYDHGDPGNPVQIGGLPIAAQAVAYRAASGWLVVADVTSVHLADVSNPAAPAVFDTQPVLGGVSNLQFSDDGLFVLGAGGNNVHRWDVDSFGLFNLQTMTLPVATTDLDVSGNLAAVGTTQGLTMLDLSNLTILDEVLDSSYDWAWVSPQFFTGAGSSGGINFYNATVPTQLSLVQTIEPGTTFNLVDMAQNGVLAAADAGFGLLRTYDVQDPFAPVQLGSARLPGVTEQLVASNDGRVVAGAGSGLVIIHASGPDGLDLEGTLSLGASPTSAVHDPTNRLLHVGSSDGTIITFDTTDPANPTTVGTFSTGQFILELSKVANALYVRNFNGLLALDYTNAVTPFLIRSFTGLTGDIDADGDRLVRARTDVPIVEIFHGADAPLTVGIQTVSVSGFAQAIDLRGTEILAAVGAAGIRHIDFTSGVVMTTYPAYPFMSDVDFLGSVSGTDYATWANGARSYYFDLSSGVEIDLMDLHAFVSAWAASLPGALPGALRSAGATPVYLYGTSPQGSIFVLDVTDPSDVSFVGEYTQPGFTPQFAVPSDEVVYVGDNSAGGRLVILPAHAAGSATGAADVAVPAASGNLLGAAWPNPFAASTTVPFTVRRTSVVNLSVFDVTGRLVRTLASGGFSAGEHVTSWDGQDGSGRPAAAGVYFVRLDAGEDAATRRIVRLR
ncbi:MAG: FlgD immunoglobulin-like domain containing protein [Candidatus Eiseniibacteriota bacterium]